MNKIVPSLEKAVADVADGATLLIGGFGASGVPTELLQALLETGARELTIVNNNAGNGERGLSQLIRAGRVPFDAWWKLSKTGFRMSRYAKPSLMSNHPI